MINRWKRDTSALTAIEFALTAPVLLAFIFVLIEGGRLEWTRQVLQEVNTNAVRCMTLGQDICGSTSAVQGYARSRGLAWGVSLDNATITVATDQTCGGVSGMNRITIALPYNSVIGLLPAAPNVLSSTACYPAIS